MSYEEEDTCHMRRRIHACHMRRRIHRNQKEQQKLQGGGGNLHCSPNDHRTRAVGVAQCHVCARTPLAANGSAPACHGFLPLAHGTLA